MSAVKTGQSDSLNAAVDQGLFENAFQYAAIGMALVSLDGKFFRVNNAFCRLLGHPEAEILKLDFQTITHPEDLDVDLGLLARLLAGEIAYYEMDKRYFRADGRVVWVHLSVSLMHEADGRPKHFISQVQDLTARIEAQQALEQKSRDLETAREAALLAKAEAEAAVAVKSEFLANMSHEIRTPLTAIVGFANLLQSDISLGETARDYVHRVSSASQVLLTLVNDVLDFSKLEAGHIEIDPQPVAPVEFARDTLQLFESQAASKGLSLDFRLETEFPEYVGLDADRLRQVVVNLIGNAIKFTEAGRVLLSLRYDDERQSMEVSVQDTGPGLTAEQRAKLFQRFSQVDASSTRRYGGTGLGLAICKGFVEAMGGEIGVRAEVGRGSTFFFHIPAPVVRAHALSAPLPEAPVPVAGVRILVVDDNRSNRDLVRAMLEAVGAVVSEAADGEAAIQSAAANPYDMILMDIRMPGIDGPVAVQRIRADPGPNRTIPIFAFSADTDLERFAEADHGFDDIVRKPIHPAALISTVAKWTT